MKRVLWTCVLGLLVAVPANADLLIDPGMNVIGQNGQLGDTPDAPWVVTATRGGVAFNDGAASEAFADHDGGGYGLYFRAFMGDPPWEPRAGSVDVSIHQDVAGTPGVLYTLTGWWGAEQNFSGFQTPGANVLFALDFLNGGGGLLGSAILDLEAAGLGGPVPGLNYEQFSVSAIAPNGTVTVRARGTLLDGVFYQDPGQALVTDEWSLQEGAVPEPSTVALWSVGLGLLALRRRFNRR